MSVKKGIQNDSVFFFLGKKVLHSDAVAVVVNLAVVVIFDVAQAVKRQRCSQYRNQRSSTLRAGRNTQSRWQKTATSSRGVRSKNADLFANFKSVVDVRRDFRVRVLE